MGMFDFLKPRPKLPAEADAARQQFELLAFPGGQPQIDEETDQLHALLQGKLSKTESRYLLRRTKALLIIAENKSEPRITSSILACTDGKLTQHDAHQVYVFLTGQSERASAGADGSSAQQAVVINAPSTLIGIFQEYECIERTFAGRYVDYRKKVTLEQNGRHYDVFTVIMKDGSRREVWFDITPFFGK